MTSHDLPRNGKRSPRHQISNQSSSEPFLPNLNYSEGVLSSSSMAKQKSIQYSYTACAEFIDHPSRVSYVNLPQLNVQKSPHEDFSHRKHHKPASEENLALMTAKRRRYLRQSPPASELSNTPRSSRLSSPTTVAISLVDDDLKDMVEAQNFNYHYANPSGFEARDNVSHIYHSKPYLQTPPSTISECSPRAPSTFDGRSSEYTAYCTSPRSNDDDEVNETDDCLSSNEEPRPSPRFDNSSSPLTGITTLSQYPQTLELCQEPLQVLNTWNDCSLLPDKCYWPVRQSSAISDQSSGIHPEGVEQLYEAVVETIDSRPSPMDTPIHSGTIACQSEIASSLAPALTKSKIYDSQGYHHQDEKLLLESGHLLSEIHLPKTFETTAENLGTDRDMPFNTSEREVKHEFSNSQSATEQNSESQDSLDMYLKKDPVAHWSLNLPDNFQETADVQSPSTSILMATAEEDLERRVSAALNQDPVLAQALLSKLKNDLPFLLPLFCEEEESSPFEAPQFCSYAGHERGASRNTNSSSAPSTTGSKSNIDTSITTPATSADIGRDGFDEEADDEGPSRKRSRLSGTVRPGDQVRRRFRCHFHAKSPTTHCQKICVLNGWLNIHNLRGHYKASHTVIRCHRCFREFKTKPEKNQHQLACVTAQSPPAVEKIDCVIKDEIDHILGTFRSWHLDTELDNDMKNWVIKYMGESAKKDTMTDEATDPRELAKWYHIWCILFPSFPKPVPSPFQDASMSPGDMKLERWLAMLQKLVETQVDQNRPPPANVAQQIEYYKDAFRTIHRIAVTESDSRHSPDSDNMVDARSVLIPLASTPNTFLSNSEHIPFSPPASSYRRQTTASEEVTNPASPLNSRQYHKSPPATFSTPLPGSSMRSPCSAETSGAIGKSPVIKPQLQSRKSSGVDAAPSPSTHRSIDFHLHSSLSSQEPGMVPAQTAATISPHLSAMRPPPRRNQPAPGISPQSIDQQTLQQYHPRREDFPHSNMTPMFSPSGNADLFDFSEMLDGQGSHRWQDMQMTEGPAICQMCMGSRMVSVNSQVQPCPYCVTFYDMQS